MCIIDKTLDREFQEQITFLFYNILIPKSSNKK